MNSGRETATLERSDWKSENIRLLVELRMCSGKAQHGVLLKERAVGKENITLKEKQLAIFKFVLLDKKMYRLFCQRGLENL